MVPGLVAHQGVAGHRLFHLFHALQEVAHVDLSELEGVERLDLVDAQLPDGSVGGVPRQAGQVRAGIAAGQLGDLKLGIQC